ncbi:Uncharacterised protein [Escherichia coli]|nr:Uncharacterised protein [Escherichia coli]
MVRLQSLTAGPAQRMPQTLAQTLVWEKAQRYPLVYLFRGLQPLRQQAG